MTPLPQNRSLATIPSPRILDNILEHIGDTPLVRLHQIPRQEDLACEIRMKILSDELTKQQPSIVAKCEFFNATGSVKDRIALRMVEEAEKAGKLTSSLYDPNKQATTIIESTSGNTGIGLALVAAIKGYNCVVTLPEKMSTEKVNILHALGAKTIRTPTELPHDSPDSHFGVAFSMHSADPKNTIIVDQYSNPANPDAHYYGTAEEIWRDCKGRLDAVVAGAGTGGTITGISRRLKELDPNIKIIAVDPVGSLLAGKKDDVQQPYKIEGIGYDFAPEVLKPGSVDHWIKVNDKESFLMARRLIRHEGLLCGGSSGSAMAGAIKAITELGLNSANMRIVVILPDSARNYMTRFVSDDWMLANGFMEVAGLATKDYWHGMVLDETNGARLLNQVSTLTSSALLQDAASMFKREVSLQIIPIVEENKVIGSLTRHAVVQKLAQFGSDAQNCSIQRAMTHDAIKVKYGLPLSHLARIVNTERLVYMQNSTEDAVRVVDGIKLVSLIQS